MRETDEMAALEIDPIEGYCLRCRDKIEMDEPLPIWTRKGQPATQGTCPLCGGTVFRMGKTPLHEDKVRPSAVIVAAEQEKRARPQLTRETVYLHYDPADEEAARQMAADLGKSGLAVWLHEAGDDASQWAGGVHPALKTCARMVVLVSSAPVDAAHAVAWTFFKDKRKPLVVAHWGGPVAEGLRRCPRFDFAADYKRALREMVNALSV